MNKIVTVKQSIALSEKLRKQNKRVVLVGGCFDILHIGHVTFLEKAKKLGDFLFVMLENDRRVKEIKGKNRPANTQKDRAKILNALSFVDCVILLPSITKDKSYDALVARIKPAIIATTKGDPARLHKERQVLKTNARLVDVTKRLTNASSTKLAKILSNNFV